MKRLLVLLLIFCLPLAAYGEGLAGLMEASPLAGDMPQQAIGAQWQGQTLTLSAVAATGDHNALAVAWEVTPLTQDNVYLCLERVYVNGMEVSLSRSLDATYGWLAAKSGAAIWDMSAVPRQESYTVVMSFLALKPTGEVTWLETPDDTTDYLTYQQSVIDMNNAGHVVSNPDGYVLLSAGTYDAASTYPYQLLEAGKMEAWENPAVSFTFTPAVEGQKAEALGLFAEGETAVTAEWSPLSLSITMTQTLSSTLTQTEAEAAARSYAVLDRRGKKDWYQGDQVETEDMVRQGDGSWLRVTRWSTQSLESLPDEIRLTPYTYDATMSRLYDEDEAITVTLK